MKINKTISFLVRLHVIWYILVAFVINLSNSCLIYFLFPKAELINNITEKILLLNTVASFIIIVVFAPIIETLFFQVVFIHFIRSLLTNKYLKFYLPIVVSGILFGLNHCFDLIYTISTTVTGLYLAFVYTIFLYRKESSITITAIIHMLWNGFVFVVT